MRWILLALGGAFACRAASGRASSEGILEASWRDSTGTVQWSGSAEAQWCARDTLLELIATRNDTAVGVALFLRDSLRADAFPLFQASIFAPWRPQGTAALRAVTENELRTWQSVWGRVELTSVTARRVSGTLDLHLKYLSSADSLHVTGRFSSVPVRAGFAHCGRANKPATG